MPIMKLKPFQKQDLARAALKDGLILGWDTGMGKTWAMFIWPLLKVGFDLITDSRNGEHRPKPHPHHCPRRSAPADL